MAVTLEELKKVLGQAGISLEGLRGVAALCDSGCASSCPAGCSPSCTTCSNGKSNGASAAVMELIQPGILEQIIKRLKEDITQ